MKKIIVFQMLVSAFVSEASVDKISSPIMNKALQFIKPLSASTIRGVTPAIRINNLGKVGEDYWNYLTTGRGDSHLYNLITPETEENGSHFQHFTQEDILFIKNFVQHNFIVAHDVIDFAFPVLPEWLDVFYDNQQNEILSFVQGRKYSFLGPDEIRQGVADYVVQEWYKNRKGYKQYLYVKKGYDFASIIQKEQRKIEEILSDAKFVFKYIRSIRNNQLNEEGENIQYLIVSLADLANQQTVANLQTILNTNPTLKIIVAFNDTTIVTPANFTVPNFIRHLVITGMGIRNISNLFLFRCSNLISLDIASLSQVTSIGNEFLGADIRLTSVDFSGLLQLRQIGDGFLTDCIGLTSLDLTSLSEVTQIGQRFLLDCSGLINIDLSALSRIQQIGDGFLVGCINLDRVDLASLSKVTEIGNYFLSGCSHLVSLDLASLSKVTQIGDNFLSGCSHLVSLDLTPLSKVTQIGYSFLQDCSNLANIHLSGLSQVTIIYAGFLNGCSGLTSIDLTPFSRVTHIGDDFLMNCEGLTILDLRPLSKVTQIGHYFFSGCSGLSSLDLRPLLQLRQIGRLFLYSCDHLRNLYLPQKLESIGRNFLTQCNALQKISATQEVLNLPNVKEFLDSHERVERIVIPSASQSAPAAQSSGVAAAAVAS